MTSKPKSWRDELPIHPAADLFPRMSEVELRELGEDIKKTSLREPPVLYWDINVLKLLDGINRLDAMELVGIKLEFIRYGRDCLLKFDEARADCRIVCGDPIAFVLSANLHRRHLTAEQKRELIAKLLKATPEKSDRWIAKETDSNPNTVGRVRKTMETTGDVSLRDTRTDTRGRQQQAHKPPTRGAEIAATNHTAENSGPVEAQANSAPPSASYLISRFVSEFEARVINFMKALDTDECTRLIAALRENIDAIEMVVAAASHEPQAGAQDELPDMPDFLQRIAP